MQVLIYRIWPDWQIPWNAGHRGSPADCWTTEEAAYHYHCFRSGATEWAEPLLPPFHPFGHLVLKSGSFSSYKVLIFGFKYRKSQKETCHFFNFILNQSKMAVYLSWKKKVEDSLDSDIVLLFSKAIKARILIDFKYCIAVSSRI